MEGGHLMWTRTTVHFDTDEQRILSRIVGLADLANTEEGARALRHASNGGELNRAPHVAQALQEILSAVESESDPAYWTRALPGTASLLIANHEQFSIDMAQLRVSQIPDVRAAIDLIDAAITFADDMNAQHPKPEDEED